MMKTLYMIGGTMGVGKTTVCQQLKQDLQNSVFIDGDWCWDASPFQVTDETNGYSLTRQSQNPPGRNRYYSVTCFILFR